MQPEGRLNISAIAAGRRGDSQAVPHQRCHCGDCALLRGRRGKDGTCKGISCATGGAEQDLGVHCRKPYDCVYRQYCERNLPSPSVFDLYRITAKKAYEYYDQGIVSFDDVVKSGIELNPRSAVRWSLNSCSSPRASINSVSGRSWIRSPIRCTFSTSRPFRRAFRSMTASDPISRFPFSIRCTIWSMRIGNSFTKNFSQTKPRTRAARSQSVWSRISLRGRACLPTTRHLSARASRNLQSTFPTSRSGF